MPSWIGTSFRISKASLVDLLRPLKYILSLLDMEAHDIHIQNNVVSQRKN